MKKAKQWASAAALVALAGTAQAALISQGNGTVLDTATNLVWLQDWNVNGQKDWGTQKAWAENLSFAGSSDWVLPSITDYLTLYAELGNLTVVTAFTNVQICNYWSATEITPGATANLFCAGSGGQTSAAEILQASAVAVRSTDVAAAVPEPQTLALALLALGAAVAARRRRPA